MSHAIQICCEKSIKMLYFVNHIINYKLCVMLAFFKFHPFPVIKGQGRIEKTEIIEMAIRHIKTLQAQVDGKPQPQASPMTSQGMTNRYSTKKMIEIHPYFYALFMRHLYQKISACFICLSVCLSSAVF